MDKFLFVLIFLLLSQINYACGQDSVGTMQARAADFEQRAVPRYQLDLKPHELPQADSPAAQLVAKYCIQCHTIPSPSIHQGNEWDRALSRMFWRMESLSRQQRSGWWPWPSSSNTVKVPTLEEQERITHYIKKHSLRRARTIPEPASAGAEVFKYTCSQCHVLPDISIHSADEWPRTVEKMQKYLDKTILGPMYQEELDLLLPYLQRNGRRFLGRS